MWVIADVRYLGGSVQGDQGWQDEVLMIQEGQCWVIDDVRYLGGSVHATAGTLRQSIENR